MSEINVRLGKEVLSIVSKFSGKRNISYGQYIYKDLGVGGGDSIELIEEIEHIYSIDLSDILPHGSGGCVRDLTVGQLTVHIEGHLKINREDDNSRNGD